MQYDLVVIGSGPGGTYAALQGAKVGKKVAIIEAYEKLGGACIHFGTLPSKSLKESVYRYSMSSRGVLGKHDPETFAKEKGKVKERDELPDMARLWTRRDRVVEEEAKVVEARLARNKIQVYKGWAYFLNQHEIEIRPTQKNSTEAVQKITAKKIVIATGARPVASKHLPVDGKYIHDSNTILTLDKVPRSMAVLGAGVIGCEYASMFLIAGTRISLIDKRNEILASVDREVVGQLTQFFTGFGMELYLECEAKGIELTHSHEKDKGKVQVHLSNGTSLNVDCVLMAQGRQGNTDGMGLENMGLKTDARGLLNVNLNYQTDLSHVYAVGDVIGFPALACTSMEQGRIACGHAFSIKGIEGMPELFPYGIYTIPEISTIGETEESLKEKKVDYAPGKAFYREVARGQIVGDRWGMLKILVCKKTYKLLGVHIIGENATELIHIAQAVMALGGDVHYFIHQVFNFPTFAEAYKSAAFNAINRIEGRVARWT